MEAENGRIVTLIGLGRSASRESVAFSNGSLEVIRLRATQADKTNILKRAMWAFVRNNDLLRWAAKVASKYDSCEVRVTGSPPFLAYQVLLWAALSRRVSVTYRITDFYPETAFAAGKGKFLRPLIGLFYTLRRRVDRIEALSDCQRRRLVDCGVPNEKIIVLRDPSPVAFPSNVATERRPFARHEPVLLYSGNLGLAHDWQTFAQAYRLHVNQGSNRVRLWLNATGLQASNLEDFCLAHALPIHRSQTVPLTELAGVLQAADAHLVTLNAEFWGFVIPSKIYACLLSTKPVLYIGPAESDLHALVSADSRGWSVRNGDVATSLQMLEVIADRKHANAPIAQPN
jgi:hypothetical protein